MGVRRKGVNNIGVKCDGCHSLARYAKNCRICKEPLCVKCLPVCIRRRTMPFLTYSNDQFPWFCWDCLKHRW